MLVEVRVLSFENTFVQQNFEPNAYKFCAVPLSPWTRQFDYRTGRSK